MGRTNRNRDAVALTPSPLGQAGTRAHGHEFHRTAVRSAGTAGQAGTRVRPPGPANAWRWQGREAVVTEGYVRGQVHASYLRTHWNGLPGAAARITAAAREYRQARGPGPG